MNYVSINNCSFQEIFKQRSLNDTTPIYRILYYKKINILSPLHCATHEIKVLYFKGLSSSAF